jgi:hypothetical protein
VTTVLLLTPVGVGPVDSVTWINSLLTALSLRFEFRLRAVNITSCHSKIMRLKVTPKSPEEVLAERW